MLIWNIRVVQSAIIEPVPTASTQPTTVSRGAIGVLLLALLSHVGLFLGLHGNFEFDRDAPHYARISHELEQGTFELAPHPFSQRFGVTVPTAVSYRLFGVNPISTTLWPLLCSLAAIVIVFSATARFFGGRTAAIAAVLLAFNLVEVRYSSRLVPDLIVSTLMLATAALVHAGRYSESRHRQLLTGVFTASALSLAVLAKETAIWIVPFLIVIMVGDLVRRRYRYLWAAVAICGLLWLGVILFAYHEATGDALFRLSGIDTTHNARSWSFYGRSHEEYVERLTIGPARFFLEQPGFFLLIALALPASLNVLRPARLLPPGVRYWGAYLATLFVVFWFGTTSFDFYNPLPLVERFLIPLIPPLCILAAVTLTHLQGRGARTHRFGIGLSAATYLLGALLLGIQGWTLALVYGALGLVMAGLWHLPPGRSFASLALRTFAALLYVAPLVDYARSGDPLEHPETFTAEQAIIARHTGSPIPPTSILTDEHSAFVLPFYFSPEGRKQLRVLAWDDGREFWRDDGRRKLVYVHHNRLRAMSINWGTETPNYALNPPEEWRLLELIEVEGRPTISLYEIDE